ncbi:hypothetical protein [Legionella brunensis]|uniref:Uncharacterized protein n=1 Tax=Legionella brunensis TaxID=29422 RepID=A0A0W0RZV3_9GAMM|nr:hypothetical protein [Legionella brunensis]KTC76775.1 hypothetical protein Lbru_2882 [Legionella brunensis]
MVTKFTNINIETLVLVAVWRRPFVFQGCFKITKIETQERHFLFFRCESNIAKQTAILNDDFTPDAYEFTHLYHASSRIQLDSLDNACEQALYLLKYTLNLTLQHLLKNSKKSLTYMDEVAEEIVAQRIKPILNYGSWSGLENIGFAVAVDFNPQEEIGEAAASALTDEAKLGNSKLN